MNTVILPFLGYCALQLFAGVVGLNVPGKRSRGADGALESWVMGQMLMYAILQAMAVQRPVLGLRRRLLCLRHLRLWPAGGAKRDCYRGLIPAWGLCRRRNTRKISK